MGDNFFDVSQLRSYLAGCFGTWCSAVWTNFESCWYVSSNQRVHLSLEKISYRIKRNNTLYLIGKLFCGTAEEVKLFLKLTASRKTFFSNNYQSERKINKKDYFQNKLVLNYSCCCCFFFFSIVSFPCSL